MISQTRVFDEKALESQLDDLDIDPYRPLLVHASLSVAGTFAGGADTLLRVLERKMRGCAVVFPTFTPQLTHPSVWTLDRLAGRDSGRLASEIVFDARLSPCGPRLGVLPELFRARAGVRRSSHPHTSFAAVGPESGLVAPHPLAFRMSDTSPLGRLHALNAQVMMIGTSWSTCTSLHLAEYRTPYAGRQKGRWRVPLPRRVDEQETSWNAVEELLVWEGDFERIGEAFERGLGRDTRLCRRGFVGAARCRVVEMSPLVDFAGRWLRRNRNLRGWAIPPGWSDVKEW